MSFSTWMLFVTTVFVVSATPGPNMLLAMSHGIRYGVRHTLPTLLGLLTALALIMVGSAAGLGAVLAASEGLFALVKYSGAAYLIWLGIKTWRAVPVLVGEQPATEVPVMGSCVVRFRTGFWVAMSNPKAFVFFTALFPQFMDAHQPQAVQLAILAATFFVIETSGQFLYASGGARLTHWLHSPARMRQLNRFAGGSFIVAGLALSAARRVGG